MTQISQTEEQLQATYESLQTRLVGVLVALDNEERYTKTLEFMQETRTKNLAFMRRPIAELRQEVAEMSVQGQEKEAEVRVGSRTARKLRDQQQQFADTVMQQRQKREELLNEDLSNARLRKEFEVCTERYRQCTQAADVVQTNIRSLSRLERSRIDALEKEELLGEHRKNEAYIARQDVSLEKMRRAVFIAKAEEIVQYYEYLKHTEATLNTLTEQLMAEIAQRRDQIQEANEDLDAVRKGDTPVPSAPPSTLQLEEHLRDKQLVASEFDQKVQFTQARDRELQIVTTCEVLTRLRKMVAERPAEIEAVKSSTLNEGMALFLSDMTSLLSTEVCVDTTDSERQVPSRSALL